MTDFIMLLKEKTRAYRLLGVLFWIGVWQLAALAVGQEFLLASPLRVLHSLLGLLQNPDTYSIALRSTARIMLGFFAGAVFGIALAALSFRFSLAFQLASPLVSASRAVPVASITILAIILVSSAWLSTLIAFLIGFPVLYAGALEGMRTQDPSLREMAGVFRVPANRRLLYLTLPQLMPHLRVSASVAMGMCWKSGVAAEVIGIPRGTIGEQLYGVKVNYLTADLFAWTVIIVLLSLMCAALLRRGLECLDRRLKTL